MIDYRLMTLADIEEVMEVERLSFTSQWTASMYMYEVGQNPLAHYIVAVDNERIIGFFGMWIVAGESHVTNVAVHPDYRGRKIGDRLMQEAIAYAKSLEASRMTLEVRVSNDVAQNLYRKYGFQDGGIRKKYYTDDGEDALVMWVEWK